ncbi:DUF3156 family protein [Photorhabdus luminescens]|uniref:DUF3156 family protein n=1 Tax=Photorhabdus luminescens TaxID=29488 RepID=UPI00223EF3A7|nr:DUF3156 family protein [Photorhabdus luminescens]MCW7762196.1 DUF3156 family protein [Photorhabdus luminescens subsp. venezuelensis]
MSHFVPLIDGIWRRLNKPRYPTGYQAGITLNRLEQNLSPYCCERLSAESLQVTLPDGLQIEVYEKPKALFLAYIVSCYFRLQGITSLKERIVIRAKVKGIFRRKTVTYYCCHGAEFGQQIIDLLNQYPLIGETLAELDFRDLILNIHQGQWQFEVEHFAASEVVSRLPASRRYLRLTSEQRYLLLSTLLMFKQLMEKI